MASAFDMQRLGLGCVAVAMTAILIYFGTGMYPFWPLMWFAMLPVLLFAANTSLRAAALATALAVAAGLLNIFGLLHGTYGMPFGVIASIYLAEALEFVCAVLLFRALLRRGAYWSALLAFPAVLVAIEYVISLTSVHGTAGSLAYSQLHFLPFLQLASVTGPWGMSFVLMLLAPALAIGWHLRTASRGQAWRITATAVGVIATVLIFGTLRLALPAQSHNVKVGLIASDGTNENVAKSGAPALELFRHYAEVSATLAAEGAQAVVMPEKIGVATTSSLQSVDAVFQPVADKTGAVLVAGMIRVAGELKYNEARIYRPGQPALSYDKEHMLPPFESDLTPGTTLTHFPEASGTWGVEVCKDMDFTQLARRYGNAGAGLMLIPGWDFVRDWISHGHMAIMRGVESGFSIVRAAKDGSLYVSDSRGRELAETRSDSAPFATLLVTAPVLHTRTLYLVLGDWFAWLALTLLAFTLLRLIQLAVTAKQTAPDQTE